jgi:hypothetical protein
MGRVRIGCRVRIGYSFLLTMILVGCVFRSQDIQTARSGPPEVLTAEDSATYAERQAAVLRNIQSAAGLPSEPTTSYQWKRFGASAFTLADEECDNYMAAIRRVNIARRQATQELNLVGTATTAALGIAQVAREAVALTATSFGVAQASIDNLASGVLYDLPPSAVNDLVRRVRSEYESTISRNGEAPWADRPTTFRTIRGYVELCLPVVIEGQIAASITAAVPQVTTPPPTPGGTATPPLVQIQGAGPAPPAPPPEPAPPVRISVQSPEKSAYLKVIASLPRVRGGTTFTPESQQLLLSCFQKSGVPVPKDPKDIRSTTLLNDQFKDKIKPVTDCVKEAISKRTTG